MKIGYFTASMSRTAGGLFWSVRSLAKSVRNLGGDVQVFAGQDKYSNSDKASWGTVPLYVLPTFGPVAFGYQPGFRKQVALAGLDLVHVHGLWMYPSLAARSVSKRGVPYVISPRGMLDAWALKNSVWKKRVAAIAYENKHLRGAACIHALCQEEYRAVRLYGLKNPVAIIPNGVDLPKLDTVATVPEWALSLPAGCKVLLFLGRIHPKKGLSNLIFAWKMIRERSLTSFRDWHLVVAGWDQQGHEQQLKNLAAELDVADNIHFVGPQFDADKHASLTRADAFILPSLSEGLPMAVLEAWSHGLPVLMTPECNLPEGFAANAAVFMTHESASIGEALVKLFAMSADQRRSMGLRGRQLVSERFFWPTIATKMKEVYTWVLEGSIEPECVIMD
ncbi:glycosyltransferase [Desulfofustis glycolicus]|uniref:Poly(Glycerol-phosphate) alpha-glucosyltransferase n=1 Tax=Desulfofustis glycolicus DSM 9705 TaxID=1121409 RepID=A0A1M5YPX6_9BACT|nr:glycosyltransferase [Desulfofustis glycolicus]MCB2218436.1 glycosyltransferase [Desulfobulbaceae bacterium]SHI13583.1 poly(glycerol-phosphate) alpha-glucosyltransferase [Desulfofustis glycolicus DSM 9705]